MFRSQQIIIREYVCTSLKLLNYLKTEFNPLKPNDIIYIYIYIYIYISYRTANLQILNFIYLFNKYTH